METRSQDALRALGHLALGTRLKRLGDRLQAHTQVILDEASVPVPASHLPPLAALKNGGAMTVGDLSRALGVTQPGVTRMTAALESAGLVRSGAAEDDRRARMLVLTPAGRQLLARLERRTFPLIEAAVREACGGASGRFLAGVAALEDALEDSPLAVRTIRLAKGLR
jgi:DNA-binding MarR family transcriptional regulator